MILLGIVSGYSDIYLLKTFGLFIADVFIKIFKCISLPIISLSIIVTLSNYRADGVMRTIWRRAMCYTLGTTLIAAAVSCLLYLLIQPGMVGAIKQVVSEPQTANQLWLFPSTLPI
nr:cation:dicarboxylase symporter family transporter [Legionella tunisiensis]